MYFNCYLKYIILLYIIFDNMYMYIYIKDAEALYETSSHKVDDVGSLLTANVFIYREVRLSLALMFELKHTRFCA